MRSKWSGEAYSTLGRRRRVASTSARGSVSGDNRMCEPARTYATIVTAK